MQYAKSLPPFFCNMPCSEQLTGQCVKCRAFDLVYTSQLNVDIIDAHSHVRSHNAQLTEVLLYVVQLLLSGRSKSCKPGS